MSKNTKNLPSFIGLIVILLLASLLLSMSSSSRHNATAASDISNFTTSGKGMISNNSSTVESLIIKGSELFNKFKYQDAISYYDKALSISPNNFDALVARLILCFN
jgi:tetratricopeptide (TPR) repeat protein